MEDRVARELMELVSAEFQANRQLIRSQLQSAQQVVSDQCRAAQKSLASSHDRALGLIATRLHTELPSDSCATKLAMLEVCGKTKLGVQDKVCLPQTSFDIEQYLPMIEKEVDEEIRRRCSGVADMYSDLLNEVGELREKTAQNEEQVQAMKLRRSKNVACVGTGTEGPQEDQEEQPDIESLQQPALTSEIICSQGASEVQERPLHSTQTHDADLHSCSLVRLQPIHPAQDSDLHGLHLQNSELLSTIEGLEQDCEGLKIENQSLRESTAAIESEREKAASECAKLMGHSNPKQKIQYIGKLHEENNRLRDEYQKLRKHYMKLEASKRGNLSESLPSLAALSLVGSPQHRARSPSPAGAGILLAADTGC